jgi:histone deacetylase 11
MKRVLLYCISLSLLLFQVAQCDNKLHIVYHPNYNITFYGIPKLLNLHSFNGEKYKEIYETVKNNPQIVMHKPSRPVTDEQLLEVHTAAYLESLKHSSVIARIVEILPLKYVPNFMLQTKLLNPMRYAVQGTLDAVATALIHGSAINLSGGYHHAKAHKGEGFCVYSDVALAVKKFQKTHPGMVMNHYSLMMKMLSFLMSIIEICILEKPLFIPL